MSSLKGKKVKSPSGNLKQGSLFSFFKKTPSKTTAGSKFPTQQTNNSPSSNIVTKKPTPKSSTASISQSSSQSSRDSKANKSQPTSSLWKKVSTGSRIRVWWADDRQYYAATVLKQRQSGSTFLLKYDGEQEDEEREWIDLSREKFQILSSPTSTTSTTGSGSRRRTIDESDEEEEWHEEFDKEDDDGSVYQANDQDDDDDDEEDQWMVTDDEDDKDVIQPPPKKKAKRNKATEVSPSSLKVFQHKPSATPTPTASQITTPPKNRAIATSDNKASSSEPASYKTPLRQFVNTVSPSTNSSRKSTGTKAGKSPPPEATIVSSTSSPRKALPYVKGAVNVRGSHVHNHLNFLNDPKDVQGRRPGEPGYDTRTLQVRMADWEKHVGNMTNAVKQWWDLKAQYFDTVLLFKTGKFYEMFHMDADVGVDVLGLLYMKGIVAHAGFPEISYGSMADKLVRAGYKVARVEQTETPEQLKVRKQNTKRGQKKPQVVNREVCSIVSLGTRTFCALDDETALLEMDSDGQAGGVGPLLAIREVLVDAMDTSNDDNDELQPVCEYGITLVDAVRGSVTVGQFADDVLRSRMNTLLTRLTPSEILYAADASPTLQSLLKAYQSNQRTTTRLDVIQEVEQFPKSTALDPNHRRQIERKITHVHPWNAEETLCELVRRSYYPRSSKTVDPNSGFTANSAHRWPSVLKAVVEGKAELCLSSFGAALFYLQRNLIDYEILSMGIVKAYIPEASSSLAESSTASGESLQQSLQQSSGTSDDVEYATSSPLSQLPDSDSAPAHEHVTYMSLDGTTLHNLEILTNSVDHKVSGSLWSKINYTKSPHGARFLRAWLLRPLFQKIDIDRRADAVQELASGACAVALNEARQNILGKTGDLDRLLSRIHSMSGSAPSDGDPNGELFHPNERAVLYESGTYTKRKVSDFSKVLNGLRRTCQVPELFADLQLQEDGLLRKLVKLRGDGGCFPNMVEELDWFFDNFDLDKAAKGLFEPSRGIDETYDEACDMIERILSDLEDYRQEMCNELSPRHVAKSSWKYINTKPSSKDKYLIELPASVEVPNDFLVKGKRGSGAKQVNKYRSSVVARLVNELEQAIEVQQVRKAKGMQLIFSKFDSKRSLWRAAAQATAMLDALGSLAKVASKPGYCRPTILDFSASDGEPKIDIVQGRHPCVETSSSIHSAEFIPNDLQLGANDQGESARLLLLSGPNMGGKSTLLRQTCLISILAQLGSYVPAESCSLTPIDCIYTRLGASDRILLGQSTFFVELAETAAALRGATKRSLVIMDELGRGTSTFDGTALAGATVKHLIERSQCLGLFATHYHSLLDEWKEEPKVRLGHMQCMVEDRSSEDGDVDHSITFLYTLGPGTCPKSFGINVARLASLPPEVLSNAKRASEAFEEEMTEATGRISPDGQTSKALAAVHQQKIVAAIQSGDFDEIKRLWDELRQG